MAGDNNNLSNEEPLSVNELAIRLKQRIKGHKGGIAGVWRQIDNRFKQEKIKSIEGIKVPGEKKIDYDTFRKAVYRLGSNEDSSKLEDMKFNINGNPLLLMNVFEILGINGYKDLLKPNFKKPDITDEIVYIGSSLRKIKANIRGIHETIEAGHKSIKTFKLNTDFEEITERLHSVLNKNEDPLFTNPFYIKGKENLLSEISNIQLLNTNMTGDTEKIRRKIKEYQNKIRGASHFNLLKQGLLYGLEGEKIRVLLMAMIFYDYIEYTLNNPVLKEAQRLLNYLQPENNGLEINISFILTPFFILALYLQIAILFIKRVNEESFIGDGYQREDILNLTGEESLKEHLLRQANRVSRGVKLFLNMIIKNKIENIPKENYEAYKNIATGITNILKIIFIDNKTEDLEKIIKEAKKYKTLEALYKAKTRTYSGVYKIGYKELEELEWAANSILEIQRSTARDLND